MHLEKRLIQRIAFSSGDKTGVRIVLFYLSSWSDLSYHLIVLKQLLSLQRSLLLNQRRSHLNLQQNLLIHTCVTIRLGLAPTIKIRAQQAPYPALAVTKDVNIKQIAAAATTRLLHQVSYRH